MKKQFTLVAAFALALSMQAQHQCRPAVQPHELNRALRAPKSVEAPRPLSATDEMPYDTLLLTSMSERHKYNSDEAFALSDSAYVIYDQCGRRKFQVEGSRVKRYTYETGPYNIWTLRIIETASWYGTEGVVPTEAQLNELTYEGTEKKVREVNDQKQIMTEAFYSFENGEWVLTERNRYDYSHVYNAHGELCVGHLVESEEPSSSNHVAYQWFEPAQQYVETLRRDNYRKYVTTFGTDSYTVTCYSSSQGDGNFDVREYEETYYVAEGCELGKKSVSANATYGWRHALTPSSNGFTLIYQEWDANANDWTNKAKSDFRNCSLKDVILPQEEASRSLEKGHSGEIDIYQLDAQGQPTLTEKYVAVALSDRLWKRTVEYVAHHEKEELLLFRMDSDDDSNFDDARWEKAVMNPDGSYVVYDDADYCYEFYSPSHEFLRKVKKEYVKWTLPSNINVESSSYRVFLEQQGDEWLPLPNISIAEFENDTYFNNRMAFSYDEQGRLISEILYLHDEQGKEEVEAKTLYAYTDNGYKESRYESDFVKGEWTMVLVATIEHTLLADGTVRYEQCSYDGESGNIENGMRHDTKTNGLRLNYYYDSSKKDFVQSSQVVADIREQLADGTQVTTSYTFDSDGKTPIPARKTEMREAKNGYLTEKMNANYEWDNANKRWQGTNKWVECTLSIPQFYLSTGSDPMEEYDDDFGPEDGKRFYYNDIQESAKVFANWDNDKQAWPEITAPLTLDMPDEHTCIVTSKKVEGTDRRTVKTTIVTDSNHLLLKEWKETTVQSAEGEIRTETQKTNYTYNANGYLETQTEEWGENGKTNIKQQRYYYTLKSILPTAIEQAKAEEAGIRVVNGQILSANPNEILRLYSLDGKQVATGRGTVLPPAKGIYVVRSAKGGCKVMVK